MKIYCPLLVLALAASAFSQTAPPKGTPTPTTMPTPTPERPRAIVALINEARLAAPELAVDTLLKTVESKKVTDRVWQKEIVAEALRTIDEVQYPLSMRQAYRVKVTLDGLGEVTLDGLGFTDYEVLLMGYQLKLDRLSLRSRAIILLLDLDPEAAKQMILQMGGDLGLKPRTCEDAITYSPDVIYPVVAKVAKAVFTNREVAEGRRALFVAPWIENIQSPTQIAPALGLIDELQSPPAELITLMDAAARAMDRSFGDDRSFTYLWPSITAKTKKLTAGEADPLKASLRSAYRGMLLKNVSGRRCSDNAIAESGPLPDYIVEANTLFPDNQITPEDVRPTDIGATAKLTHILTKSTQAKQLLEELIKLRDLQFVDNKVVRHDVSDVEWTSRMSELVDRILAMEPASGETEGEMLILKSAFVCGMVVDVGPGDLRKSIVRRLLRLLANSPLQKTSFIEWRIWISWLERSAPDAFDEVAAEFPNPNLKLMLSAKKLLTPAPTPPAH